MCDSYLTTTSDAVDFCKTSSRSIIRMPETNLCTSADSNPDISRPIGGSDADGSDISSRDYITIKDGPTREVVGLQDRDVVIGPGVLGNSQDVGAVVGAGG